MSGSGHQIGHRIYKDPNYPYDVRGLANPYLGLAAFTYAEREKYAGRDAHIDDALAKLTTPGAQQVLLFVTGASGSGKSSFAQAGLLPALEAHYAKRHQTLRRAVMWPSQHPLAMLSDALQQLGMPPAPPNIAALTALMQEHTSGSSINVIILDQFEEVFTQSQPIQRDDLLSWLTGLPSFADLRTHVIATMRVDYLPELFQRQHLYDLAKAGIDLREMAASELRTAIQQPLYARYPNQGKYLEAGLLDRLATDAAAEATYLPLLQVTLAHLWDGGLLKLDRYGTLTDAIQERAERVATQAPAQDTVMDIFLALVDVSLDDDARRDVRCRRTMAELTQSRDERKVLVDQLVFARLLSTDTEHRDGQDIEVVDIIHESLLTNWPRLRTAITVQRRRLQQRSRFRNALRDWEHHDQANTYLLDGVRLSEAEELAAQQDVALQSGAARELLTRSMARREAVRQRRLRQVQGAALVLAILLLIAIGAGWVAWQNASESRRLLTLALATTASTWPNNEEAFVLALAAIRLDRHTPRTQELVANVIKQYTLQNIYFGHEGAVMSIAFSPDGQTALSGSEDRTLRVWDMAREQPLRALVGHTNYVESVALSPDGTMALSGSYDEDVRLWDVATGETIRTFIGHTNAVRSVTFSPDGQTALSGSWDTTLRLWDVATGETIRTFIGHTGFVESVAFSPDGTLALSGSCIEANPDTSCDTGEIRLWDVATGETIRTFMGHTDYVTSVMFSRDGQTILSGSEDRTIRLWNITNGQIVRTFTGHTGEVWDVTFSPDGRTILSGSWDRTLRLWPIIPYHQHLTWACHYRYIPDLSPEQREQYGVPADLSLCPEEPAAMP